jgi:dTDP-4-dehydrorhamnose reductase
MSSVAPNTEPLRLWGGLECTINRVGDRFFNQAEWNGYEGRPQDIALLASLGLSAVRYPVLWERIAPARLADADWAWTDAQLPALRAAGLTVIAGLVHHGSGPRQTTLLDPEFAQKLAEYAGAVAARYPWLEFYTPINEPLTTARFSGLYGLWYPHGTGDRPFVQALLNQCRAVVLSMRAIRAVNPAAKLVQTDDLGKTYSTPELGRLASFYNERRWLAWDLLCGRVDPDDALWTYLTESGVEPADILWFQQNPCPPDIIGVNYYVTSERWLDHRPELYPAHCAGMVDGAPCIDTESARSLATQTPGIGPLLIEAWERYRLPLAVTEAHIGAGREDQMRWMLEIWRAAHEVREHGADLRAVTAWALFGSFDWNSLVTQAQGYYESGVFDVRSSNPRPTALARLLQDLSAGRTPSHPAAQGHGWWRRSSRLLPHAAADTDPLSEPDNGVAQRAPILISGASGTLGRAFARICEQRNLPYRLLARHDMDIADPSSVERMFDKFSPWAVINASGYVRVDEAESDVERCFRENAHGPAVLAAACARRGIHLTTFSSDLVFDGAQESPYVETDTIAPINVYGRSKAEGEQSALALMPAALVVRTSSFFGPWDQHNFVAKALSALAQGTGFAAPHDIIMSPTYVPDLVHTCLDLIIDGESGIWHLTNGHPVSWSDLAHRAARHAGIDASRLEPQRSVECNYIAARPANSALRSSRAILLPSLDDALARFLAHSRHEHRAERPVQLDLG